MTGVLDVLGLVVSALDRARVRYTIGGSLASSSSSPLRHSSGSSSRVAVQ